MGVKESIFLNLQSVLMWLMKKTATIKGTYFTEKDWLAFSHNLGKDFGKIIKIFTNGAS